MRALVSSGRFEEDEAIEAKILTNSIERAQKKVESNNFAMRKRVLEYDNVMNIQRSTIYEERNRVLRGENMKETMIEMVHGVISDAVDSFCAPGTSPEEWELEGLFNYLNNLFLPKGILAVDRIQQMKQEDLKAQLITIADDLYEKKEKEIGEEAMRELERIVLLRVVDGKWMDHIDAMDQLRQGISIRAYGNEDPVRAYGNEGYEMFNELNESIREETVRLLYHVVPASNMKRTEVAKPTRESGGAQDQPEERTFERKKKKVGRNDPCPCGSGKKYKHCHGKVQA